MIVDEIKNLNIYKEIPAKVVKFIQGISPDIPCGRHDIDKKCFANVEIYSTKPLGSAMFEAHNKYIDIQIVLSGEEKIYYKDRDKISYPQNFDDKNDIGYFNEMIDQEEHFVKLDGSNFAFINTHEGHAPRVQVADMPDRVKKIVIKLPA